MSSFAIKYPFFILMMCLFVNVVGVTTVARMPVDLFPDFNNFDVYDEIPQVDREVPIT
jgi:multidrug efflux pump subunit AcrB